MTKVFPDHPVSVTRLSKRLTDIFLGILAITVLSPVMVFIAAWIKLDSPGPVFFRQTRIGRRGRKFEILKFRTMESQGLAPGPKLTVAADHRVTRSGRFLRTHKLDELPQLVNVLKGEMSLVGPRPEVPEYVREYPEEVRREVLSVRPGMTDYAALEFIDEASFLESPDQADRVYREQVIPAKLKLYCRYVRERGFWVDMGILARTVLSIFSRRGRHTAPPDS